MALLSDEGSYEPVVRSSGAGCSWLCVWVCVGMYTESSRPILTILSQLFIIFSGDLEAMERASYEFMEDISQHDVIYCEVRYAPHLWASCVDNPDYCAPGSVTPKQVLLIFIQGKLES